MQAGWLQDITDWFAQLVRDVWEAVVTFFKDLVVYGLEAVLTAFVTLIEAIPVPDFLESVSLGYFLSQLPSGAQWFIVTLRIPEGMALLAAGVAFRLLRKLVTLGQW